MPTSTARWLFCALLTAPFLHARAEGPIDAKVVAYLEDRRSSIAEKCDGVALQLEVNLKSDFGDSDRVPHHVLASLAAPCSDGLDSIYQLCSSNLDAATWRPVIARELKTVRCTFEGFVPRRNGETFDVHLRKNISFANGVLTLHFDDSVEGFNGNVGPVLMAALAKKQGAPSVRADILKTGENGEACKVRSDCKTGVCAAGVCHFCDAKNKCSSGLVCDEGYCWTKKELADIAANRAARADEPSGPTGSSSSKPAGCSAKPSGAACKFGSECCSKICKSNYSCK